MIPIRVMLGVLESAVSFLGPPNCKVFSVPSGSRRGRMTVYSITPWFDNLLMLPLIALRVVVSTSTIVTVGHARFGSSGLWFQSFFYSQKHWSVTNVRSLPTLLLPRVSAAPLIAGDSSVRRHRRDADFPIQHWDFVGTRRWRRRR
jgi:hypothetical protein